MLRKSFFWVDLIFVKKEFRGKGIGKMLYADAIRIAKKKGFKKILIDIFAANKNSLDFHSKLGFKQVYAIFEKEI